MKKEEKKMKKKYVKPEIRIIPMEAEELLAPITASYLTQGSENATDDEGQMSKGGGFTEDWGNPFSDDMMD